MDVAEMIDSIIEKGGGGEEVVKMLVSYGHMPQDGNERPAGQTSWEVNAFHEIRAVVDKWDGE